MSFNNSTGPAYLEMKVNTLALEITQTYAPIMGNTMMEFALASLLFGVLSILSAASAYFLIHQGSLARTSAKLLLLSTIVIYSSTATSVAAFMWNWSSGNNLISRAAAGLLSESYDGNEETAIFQDAVHAQSWMMTIALAINVIIGDAIVWWRACVIWRNKAVYCLGFSLLTLTLAFAIAGMHTSRGMPMTELVLVLELKNAFVNAYASLTLATNATATSLIAYKAWEHRRSLKEYFGANGARSRVLRALALLVESGSIYCAFLIFVAVYQVDPQPSAGRSGVTFTKAGLYLTYGCLLTLVAIYPTIIIVIVALNRSPIDESGLSKVSQAHTHNRQQMGSTMVFRQSAFYCSSATEGEGVSMEGMPNGGPCANVQWPTELSRSDSGEGKKVAGALA